MPEYTVFRLKALRKFLVSIMLILVLSYSCTGRFLKTGLHRNTGAKNVHIQWDPQSLTLIQRGGCYGRMIRLLDGGLLCGFELQGKAAVRRSDDNGATWSDRVFAASWDHGVTANPDLLQIRDGSLFCFYNERLATENAAHHFAIACAASLDGGRTWGEPVRLYSAGSNFHEGCWEPAAIELPSGEIQLFFANEAPYRQSDEQEITLLRSNDGGHSWGMPETVCFRAGFRDGMPSPIILNDGTGIALAIEDNGFNGNLQPVIVFTSLKDNWRTGIISGASERRWSALQPILPAGVYAGAPCLRQLPSGVTVLSFQQNDDGDLHKSRMVVCVGDTGARDFRIPSHPFPHDSGAPQLWNSLCVKNADIITALSTTTINGVWGLWSMDGRLVEE